MKGRSSFIATITATLIAPELVSADMAVYCELIDNPIYSGYKSFEFYRDCGKDCNCSAFELMCLQRFIDDQLELGYYFTLESHNLEYAKQCEKKGECICNTNKQLWKTNPQVIGDYPLPKPVLVPIPNFEALSAEAETDTTGLSKEEIDEITYKKNVLAELSGGY